jgi:hypothetical protein
VEFAVNWVRTVFVLIAVGSPVSPTLAAEVNLNKALPEQLKTACGNAGGSFSQSQSGYGCGTDCHSGEGTDCVVFCPNNAKHCTAQVGGARHPKTLEQALARIPSERSELQ